MTTTHARDVELTLDETNLGDPDFWLREDVDRAVGRLRHERPITWHEHPEAGRGFWSLLRYDDIYEASRNVDIFRNREGNRIYHDPDANLVRPASSSMSELDAPEHKRSRRIISQQFTPRHIKVLFDDVQRIANRIVDDMRGETEIDFVEHVSSVLPIEVISDILGVPTSDRPMLYSLGGKAMGDQDPEVGVTPEEGTSAALELKAYGQQLAADRRKKPTEDIFSQTANVVVDGDQLSLVELGSFFSLLVSAGNETTATSMNQGMRAFSLYPEQRALYVSDMEAYGDRAVEEILRWGTPTRHVRRVVDRDFTFRGIHMRVGDKVALWFASANKDETVFSDPEAFDISRDPNPHMTFGPGGPHFCLGANLARMELQIMFRTLFTAFPDIAPTGRARLLRSTLFSGVKSLPVSLGA